MWTDRVHGYNEVVVDGPWTAVCTNKNGCTGRPQPATSGPAEYDHPGASYSASSFLGLVKAGHRYTFTASGEVTNIEVAVPAVSASTDYDLYVIDETDPDKPLVTRYNNLQLVAGQFTSVAVGARIVRPDHVYSVILYSLNSNPGSQWNEGWARAGNSNAGAPGAGQYLRTTQNDVIRIDYTDLDGVGQAGQLGSVIPGSTILIENVGDNTQTITYMVSYTLDAVGHYEYGVVVDATGPGGEPPVGSTCRLNFNVPIPSATEYYVQPNGWATQPSFATAEGLYEEGGVSAREPTDIYGIRLTFQPLEGNADDWGFIAYSTQ